MSKKKPLIILTGPTASGKTGLSIELAKKIGGEIISADSIQVYRYMDIGSAKVTKEEMNGIPHFLIDALDPKEEFNVYVFQKMAKAAMAEIYNRGHIPMIVGGTGFYIQSVLYDIDFIEENAQNEYRRELEQVAANNGKLYLHNVLRQVDPASADAIHFNNVKRVIRALEYYKQTGEPISKHNEQEREKTSPYAYHYFVLNDQRAVLYERINKRVDNMVAAGLVAEVSRLREMGYDRNLVSMQGIGYKEIYAYLEGETSLEAAIDLIKLETRHFAKRQLTWFRREKDVDWVDLPKYNYEKEEILAYMYGQIKELVNENNV